MDFKSVKVAFAKEGHRYMDQYGREYLSVTSLLKEAFPFNARAIAEKVSLNPMSEYYDRPIDEIVAQWEKSATDGTEAHEAIEAWIKSGVFPSTTAKTYPVVDFFFKAKWKGSLRSEVVLWDPELLIAGTADILEELPDRFKLWDIKTSAKLRDEKLLKFSMQLAIYARMGTALMGKPVVPAGIIWLKNWAEQPNEKPTIVKPVECARQVDELLTARYKSLPL